MTASLHANLRRARADIEHAHKDLQRARQAQETKADRVRAVEGDLALARLALTAAETTRQAAADTLAARERAAIDLECHLSQSESAAVATAAGDDDAPDA